MSAILLMGNEAGASTFIDLQSHSCIAQTTCLPTEHQLPPTIKMHWQKYSVCCGPKPNEVPLDSRNEYVNPGIKTCNNSITAYPPDPSSECCGLESKIANKIFDFIRPICLLTVDLTLNPPANFTMFAAGWGAANTRERNSIVKLHVELPFINMQQCQTIYNAIYGSNATGVQLWEKQMCAGGEKGKDSCKGDSGGPLMYKNGRAYEAVGVISYGLMHCGTKGAPGVFTNVFAYKDWILSIIRD